MSLRVRRGNGRRARYLGRIVRKRCELARSPMILFWPFSPTFVLAAYLKDKFDRTKTIRRLNTLYLSVAFVTAASLLVYQEYSHPIGTLALNTALSFPSVFLWSYYLFSRCSEIFWAFLKDAFDKMADEEARSRLEARDRIQLSLKSYLELVVNFAILYLLVPQTDTVWSDGYAPDTIAESLYFSGVTITTLGYGDYSPKHWWPQLLTVYEVFCGFILLIVCFAIYAGRLKEERPNERGGQP